jgi:hypothetical protein
MRTMATATPPARAARTARLRAAPGLPPGAVRGSASTTSDGVKKSVPPRVWASKRTPASPWPALGTNVIGIRSSAGRVHARAGSEVTASTSAMNRAHRRRRSTLRFMDTPEGSPRRRE